MVFHSRVELLCENVISFERRASSWEARCAAARRSPQSDEAAGRALLCWLVGGWGLRQPRRPTAGNVSPQSGPLHLKQGRVRPSCTRTCASRPAQTPRAPQNDCMDVESRSRVLSSSSSSPCWLGCRGGDLGWLECGWCAAPMCAPCLAASEDRPSAVKGSILDTWPCEFFAASCLVICVCSPELTATARSRFSRADSNSGL
mmetsp:Transcript_4205/g.8741  ORF Transcript_4205/g.8741 Transcript_4205/m.8741 type:complete len:202 (-) Transcript_4205:53-658(-)